MRATASLFFALTVAVGAAAPRPAQAAVAVGRQGAESAEIDQAIAEASARFGLSTDLIRAVMAAESGGRVDAVSPKGAMGLMQLMPATWREMRSELGLGNDPFQARDNILAGAGYLRKLYDRFGSPGYLAAYNAGPGRYLRHLDAAAPLPSETMAYVARVRRWMDGEPAQPRPAPVDWRRSSLFIEVLSPDPGQSVEPPLFVAPVGKARP